jgi:predicted DsbA family dithiol-disulfide isomerase
VDWRPFLLRPDAPETGWALPASIRERMARPDNPLAARAAKLGLTLVQREHIPSPRLAHQCTEFARAHGALEPFHHAVLEAYWSKGQDLSDWAVLREAAAQAGLDAAVMEGEVKAGAWEAALREGLEQAAELGVSAVPTFLIGDRFVIQGAQEAQVFRQAFERLSTLDA